MFKVPQNKMWEIHIYRLGFHTLKRENAYAIQQCISMIQWSSQVNMWSTFTLSACLLLYKRNHFNLRAIFHFYCKYTSEKRLIAYHFVSAKSTFISKHLNDKHFIFFLLHVLTYTYKTTGHLPTIFFSLQNILTLVSFRRAPPVSLHEWIKYRPLDTEPCIVLCFLISKDHI